MNKPFSLNEILADAWAVAKKNIWIVIGLIAVQFAVMFVFTTLLSVLFGQESGTSVLLQNVIVNLIDAFFAVSMYQVFFKLIDDDGEPEFPDFIPNIVKAVNFILVKLIIGLVAVVLIGAVSAVFFYNTPDIENTNPFTWVNAPVFILMAIPIIYVSIRLCFILCFIVDQDSGASESISQSWVITNGHFWFLFVIFLVILGINILGAMALFVGLLFTVPFSSMILIITYRHMVNSYTDEEEILIQNSENN